jgi:hypothetical protein
MKRMYTLISFLSIFTLVGCDWFEEGDLLEVYFGIRQDISSVDQSTTFYYENENRIDFSTNTQVFIRLDFLYIPRIQDSNELPLVQLGFADSNDYFLSPLMGGDLDSNVDGEKFLYDIPLQKNQYISYYFSIEILNPTIIELELISTTLMEQVDSNVLNQVTQNEEDMQSRVIKKGLRLFLTPLQFQSS